MRRFPWLVLLAAALVASPTRAGQVRIDVGSAGANVYSPSAISLNAGDHVVWVWVSGTHNVVSGVRPTASGVFNSGTQRAATSGTPARRTTFAWKSTVDQNFHCTPHTGMDGTLDIQPSGVPVSDFRITEVQYGASGDLDRIEITNMGDAPGDLHDYRISISAVAGEVDAIVVTQSPLSSSLPVAPGARVTIHTNASGTSTATDVFVPGIGNLPTAGSVALYAPYYQGTVGAQLTADLIIDFVQWDAASQPNSSQASAFWPPAEFVDGSPQPQHSISFCGNRVQRGPSFWSVTTPNFNNPGDNCATPTTNTSWGRIKTLYR